VVCLSSLIFGYNIGVTNLPTPLIKNFFARIYFKDFYNDNLDYLYKKNEFEQFEKRKLELSSNEQSANSRIALEAKNLTLHYGLRCLKDYNLTCNEYYNITRDKLANLKPIIDEQQEAVRLYNIRLWTIVMTLFVVGGMIGAFTSKYVAEYFGRKKGILFHYIFAVAGSILAFVSPYIDSPACVFASRFLFGVQGGMACGLIPTYLSEVSPKNLRGATGVIHQLCVTIGILLSQILGFRQLFGVQALWHVLLALPIIPAVLGAVLLLLFFSETPKALLIKNKDEAAAVKCNFRNYFFNFFFKFN
jgi:MFS family permease